MIIRRGALRSLRHRAGGALLLTVLSMGMSAVPVAAAPMQEPGPTVVATPSTIQAGDELTITGTCPPDADDEVSLSLFLPDGGWYRMGVNGSTPVLPDDSFAWSITIPVDAEPGVWTVGASCGGGFATAQAHVEVTGGLRMTLTTGPLVFGAPLHVAGTGCIADGEPLPVRFVAPGIAPGVTIDVSPTAADGSWSAVITLPPERTDRRVDVRMECYVDRSGWGRSASTFVDPAPVPEPTVSVSAPVIAAGNPVTVDGTCAPGSTAATLMISLGRSLSDGHSMWLFTRVPLSAGGTFSWTVTIPADAEAGTWSAWASCEHPRSFSSAEAVFAVTGGGGPMSIDPGTFTPGEPLHVAGSRCVADGAPLAPVWVYAHVESFETDGLVAEAQGSVGADGAWSADLELPASVRTAPRLWVWASCGGGADGWARTHGVFFAAANRSALPRTGPSGTVVPWLPPLGGVLVLAGVGVRRVAASRRPAVP